MKSIFLVPLLLIVLGLVWTDGSDAGSNEVAPVVELLPRAPEAELDLRSFVEVTE